MMILPPPLSHCPTHDEARGEGGGLAVTVTVSQSAVLKNYNRASVVLVALFVFHSKKWVCVWVTWHKNLTQRH